MSEIKKQKRSRKPKPESEVIPSEVTKSGEGGSLTDPSWALQYGYGYYPSNTGEQTGWVGALQHSVVYSCVKALAQDVASLPLELRRHTDDGGSKLVPKHPLARLLRRPNDRYTPFAFMAYLVTSHQLRGNAYAWILRDRNGQPEALIPLHPDNVQVNYWADRPNKLIYRVTTRFFNGVSTMFNLLEEDILHIKNPVNVIDGGYYGADPINVGQNVIGLGNATNKASAKMFAQGAQLQGYLKAEAVAGASYSMESAKQVAAEWYRNYGGVENYHKIGVFPPGYSFETISMNAEQAQLVEARLKSDKEVCRLFNMPPHRAGILDEATYSNIEMQNREYVDLTLKPISIAFEQEFDLKLIMIPEEDEDLFFRFRFDDMLRADYKARMEGYQIAILNGIMSPNEVRADMGKNRRTDPLGDEYFYSTNLTPGSKPSVTSANNSTEPEPNIDGEPDITDQT